MGNYFYLVHCRFNHEYEIIRIQSISLEVIFDYLYLEIC